MGAGDGARHEERYGCRMTQRPAAGERTVNGIRTFVVRMVSAK